jgi:hypothetical protein
MIVLLVIAAVWVLALGLAVALCVAARMGDAELEADTRMRSRRVRPRRFRGSPV